MKFGVLALDYDGTIAENGVLDPQVALAIAKARARGVSVLWVTGRILKDLKKVAGDLGLVDAVVAENGAVLAFPGSGRSMVLGHPPPAQFFDEVRRRRIEAVAGECIVEADASCAPAILSVIRDLELPLAIHYNRGRVMILPQAVSKATGLREALATLRLSVHNAIAIGDAENDHEMLRACEIGVAVGWGSPALKAVADEVIEGQKLSAVAEFIRRALERPRLMLSPTRKGRRHLLLGQAEDGRPLALTVRGRNMLIAGDPRSGKSWVTGLVCEQLVLQRYCVCIIDPEGDYRELESLPGVLVLGGEERPPRLRNVLRALRYPDVSVIADLSQVAHGEKIDYLHSLLPALTALRRRTGLPHRIVLDEAHYFLEGSDATDLLDTELGGYTLVTYLPSRLHPDLRLASEAIIVTCATDPIEARALIGLSGCEEVSADCEQILGSLALEEAVVLPGTEESGGVMRRFRLAQRMTSHVRHREKYIDVPVPERQAFVFWRGRDPTAIRARTLKEFVAVLESAPPDLVEGHLRRGDFSRWVADVFGDRPLAVQIRKLEKQHRGDSASETPKRLTESIRSRYDLSDELD